MKKVLLVEGNGDKAFFEVLLKEIGLGAVEVEVATPKDLGSDCDGKTELLRSLPVRLKGSEYSHIAIVVDADYTSSNGLGYTGTINKISKKITEHGYNTKPIIIGNGLVFNHSGKLNPIGVWVMPDNSAEGMFEDWLKKSINSKESTLFKLAISSVNGLANKKFQNIHQSKAEIATWMAWQEIPAGGFLSNKKNNIKELLDFNCESIKHIVEWLTHIYR